MRSVEITLVVGVGLMAAVGAVTLTRAPPRVVRAVAQEARIGREERVPLALTTGDITICQSDEVLPAGVSGIRLWMRAFFGAPVRVAAYSGSRALTEGSRGAGWTGQSVTVPIEPVDRTTSNVRLCFALGPNSEPVVVLGALAAPAQKGAAISGGALTPAAAAVNGGRLGGRVGVEYLAAGRGSWWSRVLTVARHVGLGRAFSGTWIALLVAALMAAAGVLAIRLAARELP